MTRKEWEANQSLELAKMKSQVDSGEKDKPKSKEVKNMTARLSDQPKYPGKHDDFDEWKFKMVRN